MKKFKSILRTSLIVFILLVVAFVLKNYYYVIFQKTVRGEVTGVERVDAPMAIITESGQSPSKMVFSFAVSVRDHKTGEIFVASTEDRRWAVVKPGQCAEAVFFPYAPWELTKGATYFNARLERLFDNCDALK